MIFMLKQTFVLFVVFTLLALPTLVFAEDCLNFTCCEHDVNTTIAGSLVVSNTYDSLPTDWVMFTVIVLLCLAMYLSYVAYNDFQEERKAY